MICDNCKRDFPENEIHESHDVPCYLFFIESIKRNERKSFADKFRRHWLCPECHFKYEVGVRNQFIQAAIRFSNSFFKEEKEDGGENSI